MTLGAPLFANADEPVFRPENAVAQAVALVRPSTVAIETRFTEPVLKDDYAFWQYFRGSRPLYGLWGSGFIYKDPNYVITSAFLMQDAEYVRVILDDGRSYRAELVGKNDDLEVAVLKVDWGPDLEPVSPPFGDSDLIKLGQPIAVVGKSLNSVDTYTSFGVVSAIRKQIPGTEKPTDAFLQFDASYEFSYTGGPLVDVGGNVIGMIDRTVQDFSLTNINLAVPINDVFFAADQIISGSDIEVWFGGELQEMKAAIQEQGLAPMNFDWNQDGTAEKLEFGMLVTYVEKSSPADIAGLMIGDILVDVETPAGKKVLKYSYDWNAIKRAFQVGQLINIGIIHRNPLTKQWERKSLPVQILQAPEDEDEDSGGSSSGGGYHHHG
jgi:S1-C subfamily serine protease